MRVGTLVAALMLATATVAITAPAALAQAPNERSVGYYNDAKRLIERNDLRAALIQLRNAVRADPNHLEARFDLAMTSMKLGDMASAEKDFQAALQGGLSPERVLPELGAVYLLQRKFDKVLADIQPGNRSPVIEAKLRAMRGGAFLGLNQLNEAEASIRESLQLNATPEGHVALARLARARGDMTAAIAEADRAIAVDPNHADAYVIRAEHRRASNDSAGARTDLDKAVELAPRNLVARLARADHAVNERRFDDAKPDIDTVIEVQPKNQVALFLRASILARTGKYDEANQILLETQQFTQSYPPALYLSGAVAYSMGRYEQAESELSQVVAARPNHVSARKLLAAINLRRGDAERALQIISPAQQSAPDDPQVIGLMAEAFMMLRRFNEAATLLERAIQKDPANQDLRVHLGTSQLMLGQRDQGISQLETALDRDPNIRGAANVLIMTHLRDKQFDKARAVASGLRDRLKGSAIPDFYLGLIAQQEGKTADAEANYRRALEVDPKFRSAVISLANIRLAERKYDEAIAIYQGFLQREPNDVDMMLAIGDVESRRGRPDEAFAWVERATRGDTKALNPRLVLAELHLNRNEPAKSLNVAREALAMAPQDPRLLELMGRIYLANNDPTNAAMQFRRVATMLPSNAVILHRLGRALIAANDDPGARQALEDAIRIDPTLAGAWNDRIRLEAQKVGGPAALAVAEKLRNQYPKAVMGDLSVGDVQFALGRLPEARAAFEAALAKEPSSDAVNKIFVIQVRQNESEKAIQGAREWLRRYPNDAKVRFMLSSHFLENGRANEAIAESEELLKIEPENAVVLNNLAWLYHERGNAQAQPLAERAYRIAPNVPAIADTLGVILFKGNDKVRGLELLRKAATEAPDEGTIRFHYATALAEIGRKDEARQILRETLANRRSFVGRDDALKLLQQLE